MKTKIKEFLMGLYHEIQMVISIISSILLIKIETKSINWH